MKKDYNAITRTYLQSAGLVRVTVRDAATGAPVIRQVTPKQAEHLKRNGRVMSAMSA